MRYNKHHVGNQSGNGDSFVKFSHGTQKCGVGSSKATFQAAVFQVSKSIFVWVNRSYNSSNEWWLLSGESSCFTSTIWRHFRFGWMDLSVNFALPKNHPAQFRLDAKDWIVICSNCMLKHQMLHWSCTTSLEASSIVWATWLQEFSGQRNDVDIRYSI